MRLIKAVAIRAPNVRMMAWQENTLLSLFLPNKIPYENGSNQPMALILIQMSNNGYGSMNKETIKMPAAVRIIHVVGRLYTKSR